jgi:preprotein translocase subunit SecF
VGIVLYVTLRFEYKFALTGIAALVHDVLVMVGMYSLLGYEANSSFVAALLTIVGYSINDTIVVFDRIRENLKTRRRESLADVVNASINQTMARSINTSLTTLLAVFAVFIFGGRTIRDFTVALMIGITAGTYSSVFVASPLWYLWKMREAHTEAQPAARVVSGAAGTIEVAAAGVVATAPARAVGSSAQPASPAGTPAKKPSSPHGKKRARSKKRR